LTGSPELPPKLLLICRRSPIVKRQEINSFDRQHQTHVLHLVSFRQLGQLNGMIRCEYRVFPNDVYRLVKVTDNEQTSKASAAM
jgi:hypothetical protein